jgi:quercetin dioxygenase-like cupin family protein
LKPFDLEVLREDLSRSKLASRSRDLPHATFAGTPFAKLAAFNHGSLFVGRFTGQAPWERHPHGDELVHVLDGEVDLTVMTGRRTRRVTLRAGHLVVVPRGLWHRQHARSEVTILSATPTPTDVSLAGDPRVRPRRRPERVRARRRP